MMMMMIDSSIRPQLRHQTIDARTVVMVVVVVVRPASAAAASASRLLLPLLLLLLEQAPHHPLLLLQEPQRAQLPAGPAPLPLLVPGVTLAVHEEPALLVRW